jgi:spermidine synthase
MVHFASRKTQGDIEVAVSEQDGLRSLHLGGNMTQSTMRIAAPNDLELVYTQCMMSFLLFRPVPENILMIGLGGGSLAKFVYHRMPQTKITVVEVNQEVITTANNFFDLPEEDERFEVILADGGAYIANQPLGEDIVMIDGFDDDCQVSSLCSEDFYSQVRQVLNKEGILVVNLLSRDKHLNKYLRRIETCFNGHVTAMLSEVRGNLIVFAFKQSPAKLAWKTLRNHAKALEKEYALPFPDFVSKLKKYHSGSGNYLVI